MLSCTSMANRTGEFQEYVSASLQAVGDQDGVRQLRTRGILRPIERKSAFHLAATSVARSVQDLNDFLRLNQRTYLSSGGVTSAEKDNIETEVGLFVKACGAQIERLKDQLAGAQRQQQQQPGGVPAQASLNEQTAAHYHGMVLLLAERLHTVCQAFDQCRATRFKQSAQAGMYRRPQAGSGQSMQGKMSYGQEQVRLGSDGFFNRSAPSQAPPQVQAQAQVQADADSQELLDHLNSLNKQTLGIERSVREIATLNQMFSTAVLAQAEQLEELYMNALDASHNIVIGNREIVKTLAVNKSSSRYILALFAVASLCLLFYDWFNS